MQKFTLRQANALAVSLKDARYKEDFPPSDFVRRRVLHAMSHDEYVKRGFCLAGYNVFLAHVCSLSDADAVSVMDCVKVFWEACPDDDDSLDVREELFKSGILPITPAEWEVLDTQLGEAEETMGIDIERMPEREALDFISKRLLDELETITTAETYGESA